MEQTTKMQSMGSLNQKRNFLVIVVCGFLVLLLIGGAVGFGWTANRKFKLAYSIYMDFRATEISMIELLDEYDAFRNEVPEDPTAWKEEQYVRNGQFNLAIKELQRKYMFKIRAYNRTTNYICDLFFAVACKIYRVEIPKKIILPMG